MIRCTGCRQSINFAVEADDKTTIFRFDLVNENITEAAETETDELTHLTDEQCSALLLQLQGDTYAQVKCMECKETIEMADAKLAFADPSAFFEEENICHCGGELWIDQIHNTPTYGLVCEECGWIKPKSGISGG